MIIPVRCLTCGAVVADKWETYVELLKNGYTEEDALDALELEKYCCRCALLTHVDLIGKMLAYSNEKEQQEDEEVKKQVKKT
jgi:DNA-directed RNA polymerases I, II, and III subunit RPABC5